MTWLRRLFGRRRPLPALDPAQAERSAVLAVELRILSERLRSTAAELARVHGVDRRNPHTERP